MLKHPHKNDTSGILEELHETGAACNEKDPIASNVVLSEIEIEKEHERLLRVRERLLQRAHERLLRRVHAVNERKAFFKGKPDFFTELPEDIFNLIFSLIYDLKTHKVFILTCKAHYEKWKKKVRFQARSLSEGLNISWWHNPDYQDLYQNKDTILSFLAASHAGALYFGGYKEEERRRKSAHIWFSAHCTLDRKLFPFFSDEQSILWSLWRSLPPTKRRHVYGFWKVSLTVKELHQNAIEKVIAKENHYLNHYAIREHFFLKNETQIEAYITTESKKYINPFFKPL